MTQEDVQRMVSHIMANFSVGREVSNSTSIPLNPNKEDYDTNFWDQGSWQPIRNGTMANETDSSVITLFMEDEFGQPIPEEIKEALRTDVFMYWNDVLQRGEGASLKNFMDLGLKRKDDFHETMENKYPWLRLCAGHWKVKQVWVNYFSRWRDAHMPENKPTKGSTPGLSTSGQVRTPGSNGCKKRSLSSNGPGSPPPNHSDLLPAHAPAAGGGIEVGSPPSDTGASVGSKRMHDAEESSDEGPSKKQKGKARYIPEPTNFYSSRKQSGAKAKGNMNKVSSPLSLR